MFFIGIIFLSFIISATDSWGSHFRSSSSHGSSISLHSLSSDSIPTYSIHSPSLSFFDSPSASFHNPMADPPRYNPMDSPPRYNPMDSPPRYNPMDSPPRLHHNLFDSPSQSKPSLFRDLKHNSFKDTTTTTSTYNTTPNFENYDNNTLTNTRTAKTTTEAIFIYKASNVEFNACNKNNNYYLNFILVLIFIIRML
uniref:Uncharacterized protein n=1 Tax=Meloidogyne enterolobii TaxID=390850 RepID=A0A6V7U576_MELEN|nr:unnamed protein product [Meloidogyne enterolobii]